MKAKPYKTCMIAILVILTACILSACQKKTEIPLIKSPTPTLATTTTPTPTLVATTAPTKALVSPTAPSPTSSEQSTITLLPTITPITSKNNLVDTIPYLSYQLNDTLNVFISKEPEQQKVVISNGTKNIEYNWEYNLSFGDPIVKVDRRIASDNAAIEEALYIILPTENTSSILNVDEICATPHVINISTLEPYTFSDEIELYKDLTKIEYSIPSDRTTETFSLYISYTGPQSYARGFFYPGIVLPVENDYEIVFEETKHFTKSLFEYRRLGFKYYDEIIWIGKFCDDITTWNAEDFIFLPYEDIQYSTKEGSLPDVTLTREEQMLAGKMVTLDPDDALDLNKDGNMDIISYRNLTTDYTRGNQKYFLSVNDSTIEYTGVSIYSTVYAGSLDGKTLQLMIFDEGSSADPVINVYHYNGDTLTYAGAIPSYRYTLTEDGIIANCESYHIQCYAVPFKFTYSNGEVQKVEQDFYPQGNTVTVLRDIKLYKEKNKKDLGITLKKGSEVIIVGSDLKEWVYIQDITSGEFGWLKTQDGYDNCLLPDGSALPATDLFDGLYFYG